MSIFSVVKRTAVELDEATLEAQAVLDDGRVDPDEVPIIKAYVMIVHNRAGRLHLHDAHQRRQLRRTLYGSDGAAERRGLVEFKAPKAA